MFAKYFFTVWDRLEATKPSVIDMQNPDKPPYFRYLTLMSFHVFLQEQVDVAILEVGVGGEYDSTNVVQTPVVCGITSLGLDHIALLGNTIEKIAWHKAGIIKMNVPVISSPQKDGAMAVIKSRAEEKNAELTIVSENDIEKYRNIKLGLEGDHQYSNATVAAKVCQIWIDARKKAGDVFHYDAEFIKNGLESAKWPGRCQHFNSSIYPHVDWCLDGAHTIESLDVYLI